MKRVAAIGACLLAAFLLVNYFEFFYWFYNNEMPAYLRLGVINGDASGPIQAFYEAARDACPTWHPRVVEQCQSYQIGLLGDGRYVRPLATLGGMGLTALAAKIEFMQALKFAIIALAIGSTIVCALLLLPFVARLDGTALAAIALVWVAGWLASRPLQMIGSATNVLLVAFALVFLVLAAVSLRLRAPGLAAVRSRLSPDGWPNLRSAATLGLQLIALVLCFAIGYRIHLLFGSQFPPLYLLVALALWPLLQRALPESGSWVLSGFLSAVLYVSAALVMHFYDLSQPKQHQLYLVAIFLFIAIWRDDDRVFWALPLVLLFDMQNGSRLGALFLVGEGLLALLRRRMRLAIVPAAVTAVVGVAVTRTAHYPFDQHLYSISDAVRVLLAPPALAAALAALALVWVVAGEKARDQKGPVAFDRLFIYAASMVAMAGLQIPTWGMLFDAFQFSTLFRSVGVAPAMAIFFVTAGLLLTSWRAGKSDVQRRSAIASIAALLLLTTAAAGRTIGWSQLSEGVRASVGRYVPADWSRRTPQMTLADNVVYFDADNIMTSPIMQYSMIKILLLSRNPEFTRDTLTVLPFERRKR